MTATLLRNKFSADSGARLPVALCPCVPCLLNHPLLSFSPSWRDWPILPFLPVLLSIPPLPLRSKFFRGSQIPQIHLISQLEPSNFSIPALPRLSLCLFSASTWLPNAFSPQSTGKCLSPPWSHRPFIPHLRGLFHNPKEFTSLLVFQQQQTLPQFLCYCF